MNSKKRKIYFIGNLSRGLTLIELLVVISIIGVLSSVLLVSVSTTRNRGKIAAVQSNLSTVRSEMELFFLNNNESYGSPAGFYDDCLGAIDGGSGITFGGPDIVEALISAGQSGNGNIVCAIGPGGDSWAASVPLYGGGSWCVSSIGFGGAGTASGGSLSEAVCSSS